MMKLINLSIIFLFFLLLTSSVFADQTIITYDAGTIDIPKPTITITYQDPDTPLALTEYTLKGPNGNPVLDSNGEGVVEIFERRMNPITETSPDSKSFDTFKLGVNKFLPNGNYVLYIKGIKYDERGPGKEHILEISMNIQAETMTLWVTSPRISFINPPEKQDVAVGDTKVFELEIETQYPTTCSIQRNFQSSKTLDKLYSVGAHFNNHDLSSQTTHSILVFDQSLENSKISDSDSLTYGDLNEAISVSGPFDYLFHERNADFIIICKQEFADGTFEYHQKILYVGYDLTAPIIKTAEFDPSLIVDSNSMTTTLYVESKEDFMYCRYNFYEQPNKEISSHWLSDLPVPMNNKFEGIGDYSFEIQKEFIMDDSLIGGEYHYKLNKLYDFKANLECTNLAGLSTTKDASFGINLTDELEFTVVNENGKTLYGNYYNYTSNNPEIEVHTNLLSICSYKYTDVERTLYSEFFETEATKIHIFDFDKEKEDIYGAEIILVCEIVGSTGSTEYPINIAIDNNNPQSPVFIETEFTCDGSITTEIEDPMNDYLTIPYSFGDKVKYEFSLYENKVLLSSGKMMNFEGTNLILSEDLLNPPVTLGINDYDKLYLWEIFSIDGSGRESEISKQIIERLHQNNPKCDTKSPTAKNKAILGSEGYEITVQCIDTEGNCASEFLYSQIPLGETCVEEDLQFESYSTTITFEEDSTFCYQVYDIAIPDEHKSPIYFVDITPEVNIQLITPPSGVSSTKQFDLIIETESGNDRNLDCKQGPFSKTASDLWDDKKLEELYALNFAQPFTTTGGSKHLINFDASSEIGIGGPFSNNLETDIKDWFIVCKEQSANNYIAKPLSLGFDTTPPEINVDVNPSIVENPLDMNTLLTVSSDDKTFCKYRDINNNEITYNSFPTSIFKDFQSYTTSHESKVEYTDVDVLNVIQEITCYNLANLFSTAKVDYTVEAKGTLDVYLTLEDYYSDIYVSFEAKTPGLWSDCEASIDGEMPEEFMVTGGDALNYVHEHQFNVEDGPHKIVVSCTSWFNGAVGFASKDFIVDSQDPTVSARVKDPTCSIDTVEITFSTSGTGSPLVQSTYELIDKNGDVLVNGNIDDVFTTLNDLPLILSETYYLDMFVEDTVGYTNDASTSFLVATEEHVACDFISPRSSLDVLDVYGGMEFTVGCQDDETGCIDNFYYYFDDTGICGSSDPSVVQTATYRDLPLFAQKSSTLCYFVMDEGSNPSPEEKKTFHIQQSCYNGEQDTDEDGVDCGGTCPLQDCTICQNDIYDVRWELSTDCGWACRAICDEGGFIPLTIDLVTPSYGVSPTRDFDFKIITNRNSECRFGKYNSNLQLSYQDLFEQMRSIDFDQSFQSNFNGREHEVFVLGDKFAGEENLESYIESSIIICKEFDDYLPKKIKYFGFDTTAPVMEIIATPNPTTDPSFLESSLEVTTDDLSVCKYTNRTLGAQQFFQDNDYYTQESYMAFHQQNLNYWASDEFDDVQTITCINLAGVYSEEDYVVKVQPDYSQKITILNDGKYYTESSGRLTLEVETSLYASCQYKLNEEDEFQEMNMVNSFLGLSGNLALATNHEMDIYVYEGIHDVEIKCNMLYDWFGSEEYNKATFTQDSQPPIVELSLFHKTCSLDRLRMDLLVLDETTTVESLQYSISIDGLEVIPLIDVPKDWTSSFQPFIDMSSNKEDLVHVTLIATDSAGNVEEFIVSSKITDMSDPECDNTPPTMTSELKDIWKGYSLTVDCKDDDGGSGCDDYYGYSFSTDNICNDLYGPNLLSEENKFYENGQLCYRVKDLRPNYSPLESQSLNINANCYNYEWDPAEEGVDCGGPCKINCDEIDCDNDVWDDFEEGVDCGGVCYSIRSCEFVEEMENSPFDIILISPEFGISNSKNIKLEIQTTRDIICKQGFFIDSDLSDEERFNSFDSFDFSDGYNHKVNIDASKISYLDDSLLEHEINWGVVCEYNDNHHLLEISPFGFDVSDPVIVVSFDPNPVIDPSNMRSTINVESDDPVVCTYLDMNDDSIYFPYQDISDGYTYEKSMNNLISYFGYSDVIHEQQVTCRNLAQVSVYATDKIFIEPDNTLQVTLNTQEYYVENYFDIEVTTQVNANCDYWLDSVEDSFSQTGGMIHEILFRNVPEGEHELSVVCEAIGSTTVSGVFTSLIVDTEKPIIEIIAPVDSCSLTVVEFVALIDGTGSLVSDFTYKISDDNSVLVEGISVDSFVSEIISLEEGKDYSIIVEATDAAGHFQTSTFNFRGTVVSPSCDFISPIGSVISEVFSDSVHVDISCEDADSGCASYFGYVDSDYSSCDGAVFGLGDYNYDLPLRYLDSATLCYAVYDNNGNVFTSSEQIVSKKECFNGQQDPDEDGVDCGGACEFLRSCGPVIDDTPFEMTLVTPEFGIYYSKDISLELYTTRDAECKQGFFMDIYMSPESRFNDENTFHSFDFSSGLDHRSLLLEGSIGSLNYDLDESETSWGIICLYDGEYYLEEIPRFGFDISDPVVSVSFEPNPVIDPADMTLNIIIDSDDDLVCTYLDINNDAIYFSGQDVNDPNTYEDYMIASVDYRTFSEGSHEQYVTCRNLAQVPVYVSDLILVQPDNTLEISIDLEDYYSTNNIDIELFTQVKANCEYELNSESDSFSQTGDMIHKEYFSGLADGYHTLTVYCQSIGSGTSSIITKEFVIDTKLPIIEIIVSDESCSLSSIEFVALVDGTGSPLSSFNYKITDDYSVLVEGNSIDPSVIEFLSLKENEDYTIEVNAIDTAGNEEYSDVWFTATETSPSCDFISPRGIAYLETHADSIHADISCEDDESGCASYFGYVDSEDSNCDNVVYDLGYYSSSLPLYYVNSATLCYAVYDVAGNEFTSSKQIVSKKECFNGQQDPDEDGVDCGGACEFLRSCGPVIDDTPFEMTLVTPEFGIYYSKDISLELYTTRDAECKQGFFMDVSMTLESRFNDDLVFHSFDSSDGKNHHSLLSKDSVVSLNYDLDESETSWALICLYDGEYYLEEIPRFGFDISDPVVSVSFEPNPVIDPADMSTTITVNSDDEVVCTYLDIYDDTTYFFGQDVNNPNTYKESMVSLVDYRTFSEGSHEQYVTCRNLAQVPVQIKDTILVQPDNTLQVTFDIEKYYATNYIDLEVRTQVNANCEYWLNSESDSFSQTGGRIHEDSVHVSDGDYTLTVYCQSVGLGLSSSISKDFVVDTVKPILEIIVPDESCSLSSVEFTVLADGTGSSITSFNYQIMDGSSVLVEGTSVVPTVSIIRSLEEYGDYYIEVSGVDAAGNEGQTSNSFVATVTSPSCDFISPRGFATLESDWESISVDISCEDDESGCASYFGYVDSEDSNCDDAVHELGYYSYNLPLRYLDSATLCYSVYDNAANEFVGSIAIDVEKQCFNGFEDPDEDGVDCGGICDTDCFTCDNNVQDYNEDGVDCGGVCEYLKSCDEVIDMSGRLEIVLVTPRFGIASEKTFNFELMTSRTAICKQGYLAPSHPSDSSEWYDRLDLFDDTGDIIHTKILQSSDISRSGEDPDENEYPWIVICEEQGNYYEFPMDKLGYDITPPNIVITIEPNPIRDPGDISSSISVESDDEVVCTYMDKRGETHYFSEEDVNEPSTYVYQRSQSVSYEGPNDINYEQTISCRNLAQKDSSFIDTIVVNLENEIQINVLTEMYHSEEVVDLEIETVPNANCAYKILDEGDNSAFDQTGGVQHNSRLYSLVEGTNEILITCTNLGTGYVGSKYTTVIVDTQEPEVIVEAVSPSCSLDTIKARFFVDDETTAIESFVYDILYDGDFVASGVINGIDLEEHLTLVDGGTYTLRATASDTVGLETQVNVNIFASSENHPECDFISPKGFISTSEVWAGVDASISCVDSQSGCDDKFSYYTADSCGQDYTYYDLGYFSEDNPLHISESTNLCVIVYDNAGNPSEEVSESIFVLNHCFNGFEDPSEYGVDCGGPCEAECDTCFNGFEDVFEDGVDCGGVCEYLQSCIGGSGPQADFAITLIEPPFGIANSKDFMLQAHTTRDAECRHGYLANIAISLKDRFRLFEPFETSGQEYHQSQILTSNILSLDQYVDEDETQWGIICIYDEDYYFKSIPRFGFDISEPIITTTFTPNPVTDPSDMTLLIQVRSDDEVVCTYLDRNDNTIYFSGQDVNDPTTYEESMEGVVPYWGFTDESHEQQITCRNLAQTSIQDKQIIIVQPDNTLEISINTNDYYSTSYVDLKISTQVNAYCEYMLDSTFKSFLQTGGTVHKETINMPDGEHTLTVLCESVGLGLSATLSKDFVVDTEDPIIEIIVPDESCSLSSVEFTVLIDGTGSPLSIFSYQITDGIDILAKGNSIEPKINTYLDLDEDGDYYISVRATDAAGNEGQTSNSFVATVTSPSCDFISPRGFATLESDWESVHVDISCEDDESGCASYFGYVDSEDSNCDDAVHELGYYSYNLPLRYLDSATLCYSVYDNAANEFVGSIAIDVEKQCFNGFEDPDEDGIDCGGICEQECFTCNNNVQDYFEEGIDCGGICVQPCVGSGELSIDLISPTLGVANTKSFLLEVQTNYEATCVSGYDTSSNLDLPDRYLKLEMFDTTGQLTHSTEISSQQQDKLDAGARESLTKWIVICQVNGEYSQLELSDFGFDTTPANIELYAEPNPVLNPTILRSELTVVSDDPVVCTYIDEYGESTYFSSNDLTNKETYDTTHRTIIEYWGVNNYDDEQQVICRNVAQDSTEEHIIIHVEPENEVTMTFVLEEYYSTNNIILDVSTLQNAYCVFSTGVEGPSIDFDTTGEKTHKKELYLGEGEHTIEVLCMGRDSGLAGVVSQTIVIDSIIPQLELLVPEKSCSLGTLYASALVDGTGSPIEHYSYQLKQGIIIFEEDEINGPELKVSLSNAQEGEVYDLVVTAIDAAGNTISEQKSFVATKLDNTYCDTKNPFIDSIVEYIWDGAEITVICEDEESGCAETYATFLSQDNCAEQAFEAKNYYEENPFLVEETTTACYRVYDQAGNFNSKQSEIIIEQRCFNGFEDPDEEGVDCGGPCVASCDTCTNNMQDQFELGVDCGGVCESIRSCQNNEDLELSLITPRLGISSTKEIDLSVHTTGWAFCRQGPYEEMMVSDYQNWFEKLDEFASTGGTVHEIILNPSSIEELDESKDEVTSPWVVLCENQGHYSYKIFDLGYDITPPVLELIAEPNPIVNPASMKSVLTVTSDDPVVCTYLGEDGQTVYFNHNDVNQLDSFGKQHSVAIPYWTRNNEEDTQIVTCRNPAELSGEEEITIQVQVANTLGITFETDHYSTSNTVLLIANTDSTATCGYDLSGQGLFSLFDTTDDTRHTQVLSLTQGTHNIIVNCVSPSGPSGTEVKEIIVDYTPPKIELLIPPQSCSLAQIKATIFMDGTFSEIDRYEYVLSKNQEEIVRSEGINSELIIQTGLMAYKEYKLSVTAYDLAGNFQEDTQYFEASTEDSSGCDLIPPVGSAITEITWQGAESTIKCSDEESGCSQLFNYNYQNDGQCNSENYKFGELAITNPILTTESSTLCYAVYDNANNKFEDSTIIDVESKCFNGFEDPDEEGVDCGGPCVPECNICANGIKDVFEEGVDCGGICELTCGDQPGEQSLSIKLANPRFGLSSTKNFIFEIHTTQQANCRHGYLANARPKDVSDWYLTLDEFTYSNGKVHNVQIKAGNVSQLNEELDESSTSWIVICSKNDEYLIEQLDEFGFDTTPANIDVVAQPNPVVDPGNAVSTITVESDDAIACTYQDQEGKTHYFENVNINNKHSYDDDHSVTLSYWGVDQFNHNSTISCRNIAQSSSEETITITVALTDSVGITAEMNYYYGDSSVIINASTQQLATCQFRFSEDEDYQDFALFSSYVHQISNYLDDDKYTVEINCISESTGDQGTIYHEFIVDTTKPEASLNIPQHTCNLKELSFSVLADGTGTDIDKYEYTVTLNDEIIASKSSSKADISINMDLEEDETYKVNVLVIDEAGNEISVEETTKATPFVSTECDRTPPVGNVELKSSWNGVEATITCTDKDSSCLETFDYVFTDIKCPEQKHLGKYDVDLPFKITEETMLCYAVYDEANNKFEDSIIISYEPHCFNGFEDPSEHGVDCGGTCLAECGTCNNSIKDIFEEGIDCGGVCETMNSCSDISTLYGNNDTSFLDEDEDGLPDEWEEYYFGNLDEDGDGDYDEDSLTNLEEYLHQTDPTSLDTDNDGMPDAWEINFFDTLAESANGDYDGDGLTNIIEYKVGTDPTVADVTDIDGDGMADQWEEFYFGNLDEGPQADYDGDGISNLEEYLEGFDPTVFTNKNVCEVDEDCQYGFKCDYTYNCVEDEFANDEFFEGVEKGINILGVIFLIMGLLFIGGGIGFVYYSREQQHEQAKKLSSAEQSKRRLAYNAQQKKKEKDQLIALKKRNELKEKTRKDRLSERKNQRESLIGSFNEQIVVPKVSPLKKQPAYEKPKKSSKLDDGLVDDFVDVRDLGKGSIKSKPIKKGIVKKSNKNVFDELSKLSTKKKFIKKPISKNKK